MQNNNPSQIVSAIIIAGALIAGAILLRGSSASLPQQNQANNGTPVTKITLAPVGPADRTLGNPQAKITLVLYEDFQCPFCERFFSDSEKNIKDTYLKDGNLQLVYRDFAFLGPESVRAAEAARCAGDQNQFWQYHEYLYTHQNGENQGSFSDPNLKSFAKKLNLDTAAFNSCLDAGKYAQAVADSKTEASNAGVSGTPKGFFITKKDISEATKNEITKALNIAPNDPQPPVSFYATKNIMSINGALPWSMVKIVIDTLLK